MLSVPEVGTVVVGVLTAVVCGTTDVVSADTTVVFVQPETSYVLISDTFEITVEVDSNAVELKGFDIVLSFDSEKLKLVDVIQGPLMKEGGTTFWHWERDTGTLEMVCAILGTGLSVDGPGILATISFEASQAGESELTFRHVALRDVNNQAMPCESRCGVVCGSEVGVSGEEYMTDSIPRGMRLDVLPNPCRLGTRIRYYIPNEGTVLLAIHDCTGRAVRSIEDGPKPAGMHEILWTGRTDEGTEVASGVYFAVLHLWARRCMSQTVSEKIVLVK